MFRAATTQESPGGGLLGRGGQRIEETLPGTALADRGVVDLLAGDADKAVVWLEAAVRREPQEARHWSDLAAALLDRATRQEGAHDFVAALAASRRAIALDPDLPEAWFNRALALDRLSLRSDAAAAWGDCLAHDPGPGWREEAKERRQALLEPTPAERWTAAAAELDRAARGGDAATVRRLVAGFPQPAREHVQDELLPGWARAFLDGRLPEAAGFLTAARSAGASLAALHGEHLPADAVAAIDAAVSSPVDRSQARRLAEGHLELKEGRDLLGRRETGAARKHLRAAGERLREGGSPFAAWADLGLAGCDYDNNDPEAALRILDPLWRGQKGGRSPSLLGHTAWLAGLARFRGADPSAALVDYGRALTQFERGGEVENQGAVHTMVAEVLDYLGEDRGAWQHRARSLALLAATISPKRRQAALEEVELALAAEGETATALLFRESAVREARLLGDPVSISFALLRRAVLHHRLGDAEAAARDLAEAGDLAGRAPEGPRQRVEAELALAEGEVTLKERPAYAAERLSEALAFFRRTGDGVRTLEVYPQRALARRAAGDEAQADADLAAGVAELEQQRGAIRDEDQRAAYFTRAQPLFDQRIGRAMQRGEPAQAFDDAERARARTLLDLLEARAPAGERGPLSSDLLPRAVPAGVAVVEYAVLEDRLCLWIIRHGRFESVTVKLPAARLTRWVSELRAAFLGGVDTRSIRLLSRRLYNAVVQPALARTAPGDALVFVPDKALHDLPFAALVDPATGRYLVQDHAVSVAPSASLYTKALQLDQSLAGRSAAGVLVVGDPAFDSALFPGLRRLPEAGHEAANLARLYPPGQALVLLGDQATRVRFLAEIGRYGVVQFSGHSLINPVTPGLSRLALAPALAPNRPDSGALYARDLSTLRLPGTRLIVLAACSTGLREPAGTEGASGLTRAFLAAGIPSVIASLWDVRDEPATSRLMLELHRRLLAGDGSVAALRGAQLSLLDDPDPDLHAPRTWAAFQVFGGASPSLATASRK